MIKINLALRKQPAYVGGTGTSVVGAPLTRVLTQLKIDPSIFNDLPLPRIGLFVGIALISRVGLNQYEESMISKAGRELAAAQEKSKSLSAYSSKIKEAEATRKQLADDTATIRAKVTTIQKLMTERRSSVNLLMVLSDAVPPDVWVTRFKADETTVGIDGRSAGFAQVSDFIKKLSESTYLTDLNMNDTRAEVDKGVNSELATFRLSAKRRVSQP